MKPLHLLLLLLTVGFIGIFMLFMVNGETDTPVNTNVSLTDGTQLIEIIAKGGYSPQNTLAKAHLPSLLKVKTQGTFDCSSSLVIPSLNYQKNLAFSDEALIEIPPQKEGTILEGICSMGMYHFSITFS